MRKSKVVVIAAEGRDKGKHFYIQEMPATQAEKWAARALEAIGHAGIVVPETIAQAGAAGLFSLGVRTLLRAPYAMVEPLLDEMFASCVFVVPDPKKPQMLRGVNRLGLIDAQVVGPMVDDDTEEVATRLTLRNEVLELHLGFSVAAYLSQMWEQARAAAESISRTTPTSDGPSAS